MRTQKVSREHQPTKVHAFKKMIAVVKDRASEVFFVSFFIDKFVFLAEVWLWGWYWANADGRSLGRNIQLRLPWTLL